MIIKSSQLKSSNTIREFVILQQFWEEHDQINSYFVFAGTVHSSCTFFKIQIKSDKNKTQPKKSLRVAYFVFYPIKLIN